jgi:4,5-DOPA dioxygenase extradiol
MSPNSRMPAVFFGHGNPMNALASNEYTRAWADLGRSIGRPGGILAISAHWFIPTTAVTAMQSPRTIHDFGGFPQQLFDVEYPAPGSPALARGVQKLLDPVPVEADQEWGLDHGIWSVLCHVFPQAEVPVVQLSIDSRQPPQYHLELGARLAALRDEGVLIMGSGNLVHNLQAYAWGKDVEAFDWATRFEEKMREIIASGDMEALVKYEEQGRDAMLSVPTEEHYLPLLYVLGARRDDDPVSFPASGVEGGSVSMLTVKVG